MQEKIQVQPSGKRQLLSALFASFIALPVIALLFICAYGFIVWFGQMFFWGPPT